MVVMELPYSGRASLSTMEEEEVLEREKEATKGVDQQPLLPPLFIGGPRGGPGPRISGDLDHVVYDYLIPVL